VNHEMHRSPITPNLALKSSTTKTKDPSEISKESPRKVT
jgi:hypothetical protein